jgi:DNA-binding SARP family transcriptional activator
MSTASWQRTAWEPGPEGVPPIQATNPVRIVTLGDFVVSRGDAPVALGQHQARELLAILLCARGPVHRDKLLEWLWPHLPEDRALSTLYSTVYTLRRRLEPGRSRPASASLVRSDSETYRLAWRPGDRLDVTEFLRLARLPEQAGSSDARLKRLHAAEAAYTGPFLPQWPYAEWAAASRAEVEETYQAVASDLAALLAQVGQSSAAVALYRRLLAIDPERETWHRALMEIFIAEGDRSLAAHQFEQCRKILDERLGIEPSPKTMSLFASIASSRAGASSG